MQATLLYKQLTQMIYNWNFIGLNTKLSKLDKLIPKIWNNCQAPLKYFSWKINANSFFLFYIIR